MSTLTRSLSDLSQLSQVFIQNVLDLMNSANTTVQLTQKTNTRLMVFGFASEECRLVESGITRIRIDRIRIDSLKVLRAMLNNAPTDRGERYVASAIICCDFNENEMVMLASDWVYLLLWPFKSAYKSKTPSPSPYSDITFSETATSTSVVNERRDDHFLGLLKERQANKCAVIEPPHGYHISTVGTHIIRRSIAKANRSNAGLPISLPATWDILRHYADLSEDTILGLENIVDSPSNGILLQTEMHDEFDNFQWYFEATNEPDVYNVKWLSPTQVLSWGTSGLQQVRFTDQSGKDIPLPDARFLAIHAAIAKVLHMSGAAEPLDLVMDKFDFRSPLVPSGKYGSPDLDIRLSLLDLFGDHLSHLPTEIRSQ
ncbi:hypothetical protein F5887DRAFT_1217118 [Amanita rubescens]|nr:hypothetical protein F5887DRAFT_1217118 [Amanita rubescens]